MARREFGGSEQVKAPSASVAATTQPCRSQAMPPATRELWRNWHRFQDARLGAAMAVSGGSLTERIARLLGQPEASSRALPIAGVLAILLIASAAAYGLAQSPPVPQAKTPIVQAAPINPSAQYRQLPHPLPSPAASAASLTTRP
jgi:hypothetical protein